MSVLINFAIGFLTSAITVLAVIFVFNRFTSGGVAALGKAPITEVVGK